MELKTRKTRKAQAGMSLAELLVAMAVLMIGVTGIVSAIPFAIATNYRNKKQSNSTAIAEMVLEKIMSVPGGSSPVLQLSDCAGNNPSINTAGSAGGTGAALTSSGDVDYSQSQANAGAGYFMNWTTCGANGTAATYDVRWNIKSPDSAVKIITVSARPLAVGDGPSFALPVTIRSVAGPWI